MKEVFNFVYIFKREYIKKSINPVRFVVFFHIMSVDNIIIGICIPKYNSKQRIMFIVGYFKSKPPKYYFFSYL